MLTKDELVERCAASTGAEDALWIISANWSWIVGPDRDERVNQAVRNMVERLTWKAEMLGEKP